MYSLDRRREYARELRNSIFDILGNKCFNCGFSDIRALQIDHIFGGGSSQRKSMGGRQFYKIVLDELNNNPSNRRFQILCANCNWIKRSVNNENRK